MFGHWLLHRDKVIPWRTKTLHRVLVGTRFCERLEYGCVARDVGTRD